MTQKAKSDVDAATPPEVEFEGTMLERMEKAKAKEGKKVAPPENK